ncbi:putative ubiquitin-conjugating enzyme E2 [Basidiobolus meristosporus CBS 931.73]|uniref:NEDD8-conjugating enzyme UBC12 n=1 Tax=Basidiobolus meristosporus CBS 931.73 TaxID=1314790 RepID=A0A1Y1Z8J1_9FUNG|nr:putative ubiquitin-conjugating enzyme E2 [Basidiobolus meristosporus CBS 931.73]|eukprot:ORY06571.1 putative ubiquitin-conjugating enzyme E2 [Basidiobolus meristosporus CBS 931.73]
MIKLFSMKKEAAAAEKRKPKISAAQIRVQKDLSELELPKTMEVTFPSPEDLLNFNLSIRPDEGFYKGGEFKFTIKINNNYPHEPPKIHCIQKIYHPNIDLDGNICLNILREDWKPVLNINSVMIGLQYLFLEPNADDPLNKEAAQDLRTDRRHFEGNVRRSMRGNGIEGIQYDNVMA